ncbi:MAG: LPS assembly protein LptD, partial [Pseudomonadota bacterium]
MARPDGLARPGFASPGFASAGVPASAPRLALPTVPAQERRDRPGLGPIAPPPDTPVALVADGVTYDSEAGTVTATGNVQVFYGERTLTADAITYDSNTGRIAATGDIVLRDPTGTTVFADAADLDAELYDGMVEGARSVIATGRPVEEGGGRARLAAVEGRRVDGRYNTLSRAVYSPCDVCTEEPTPLWRIRARRVIHDEEERMIHYENAFFDVLGVPVAWLPYFRHPDPTVERASGFLVPTFSNSGNYGAGLRTPFFWAIDPSTDVTFQPFFTTDDGVILDAEFRRAFDAGLMTFRGSVVQTDFTGDAELQGHVDTDATFALGAGPDGTEWGWDVTVSSDDAYLRFFEISDDDRLTSTAFIRNYQRDWFFELSGVYFQSLRDDEPAGPIPRVLPMLDARYEIDAPGIGGRAGVFANTQTLFRNVGTDTTRLTMGADWEREEVFPVGLAVKGFASLTGDVFLSFDDAGSSEGSDDTRGRLTPRAGVEARFPLIADGFDGAAHVIEPMAQVVIAPFGGNDTPFSNEDSQQTEFDELSLFDIDHFSGLDAVEEGTRITLGTRYTRLSDDGLFLSLDGGRLFRFTSADEFAEGSGLNGTESDWVVGWRAGWEDVFRVAHRLRFDGDFDFSRNEILADMTYGPAAVSVGYTFLEASPNAGTDEDRGEVTTLASLALSDEWSVEGIMQRDLQANEFVQIGGGISYANECCAIDLVVRRRFTESEDTPA